MSDSKKSSKVSKKNKWILTSLVIAIIIFGIFFLDCTTFTIFGICSGQTLSLSIGNSPVLGEENALVIIYEFTDFSCPYCEAAEGANDYYENALKSKYPGWEAPVPLIKEKYVKMRKAKIVFKYFPGHGAAEAAHAVALGVQEQNPELFWEFAEKAFTMPSDLNNISKMIELAKTLGANESALSEYISSKKYEAEMDEDIALAKANGVKGTPTFFINGEMVSGAQSFNVFEEIIENELS